MKSPPGTTTKKPVFAIIPGLSLSHQKKALRSNSVTSTSSSEEQISVVENQGLAGLAQLLKNKSLKVGSFLPMIAPPAQSESVPGFSAFRRELSSLSWLEGLQGGQLFRPDEQQRKGGSLASRPGGGGVARGGGGGGGRGGGGKVKPLKLKPAEVVSHHLRKKSETDVTSPEIPKQDASPHLSDMLTSGRALRRKGSVPKAIASLGQPREAQREEVSDCLVVSIARTVVNAGENKPVHVCIGKKTIPGISESGSQSAGDFEAVPVQVERNQIGVGGLRVPGTEPLLTKSDSESTVSSLDAVLLGRTQLDPTPSQSSEETLTASESQEIDDLESSTCSLPNAPGSEEKRPGTAKPENESPLRGAAGGCLMVAAAAAPCVSLRNDAETGRAVESQKFLKDVQSQTETPVSETMPALKSPTIVTMFSVPPGPSGSATGGSTSALGSSQPQSGTPIPDVLKRNQDQVGQLTSPSVVNQSDTPVPVVLERNRVGQLTSPSLVNQADSSSVCPPTDDPRSEANTGTHVTELPAEVGSNLVGPIQPAVAESGICKLQASYSDDHPLPPSDSPHSDDHPLPPSDSPHSDDHPLPPSDSPQSDDFPSKVPKSPAVQRLTDSSASSPNGDGSPHRSSPLKDIPMRHLQLKLKPVREVSPRKRRLSMEQGEPQLEESELQMEQGGLQLETNPPQLFEKGGPQLEKGGPQLESEDGNALICLPKRRKLLGSSGEEMTDEASLSTQREDEKVEGESVSTETAEGGLGGDGESGMDVEPSVGDGGDRDAENTAAAVVEQLEETRQELVANSGDLHDQAPRLATSEQLDVAELLTMLQETPPVDTAVSNPAADEGAMSLQDAEIAAASQVLEGVHAPAIPHQVPDLQMLLEAALMDVSVEGGQPLEQKVDSGVIIAGGRYHSEETRTDVREDELSGIDELPKPVLLSPGFDAYAATQTDPSLQESGVTDTAQDIPMLGPAPSIPSSEDRVATVAMQPTPQPQVPVDAGTGTEIRRLSTEAETQTPDRSAGSSAVPFPRFQTSAPNRYEPVAPVAIPSLTPTEQAPMEVEQDSTREIPSLEKMTEDTHEHVAVEAKVRQSTTCQDTTSDSAHEDSGNEKGGVENVGGVPEEVTTEGKEDDRDGGHTPPAAATASVKSEESEMKAEVPVPVGCRRKRGQKKKMEKEATPEEDLSRPEPEEGVETTPTDGRKEGRRTSAESESAAAVGPTSQNRDMTLNFSEPKMKGKKMLSPSPGRGSGVLESSKSPVSDAASTPSTAQPSSVRSTTKQTKSKRPSNLASSLKLSVSIPLERVRVTHYTTIECYVPSNFAPGDIVWAKGHLLPAWPGTVISHKDRRKDRLKAAPAGQVSRSQADIQTNRQTDNRQLLRVVDHTV